MKLNFRRVLPLFATAAASAATCVAPAQADSTQPDLIFVLDSSNSMWGQIDGIAKTEIAKSAFEDFVGQLPPAAQVGLVAYGHRQKADCSDVETLVPISPLDPSRLVESVRALKPRGKTPITESLRLAAQTLGQNGRPGQLILISDGIETCGGDPCALAEELAKSGIDFKAHVIGFDIASKGDQAKIACIAHLTGGKYWNAKDQDGLIQALTETAALQVTPDPVTEFPVVLTAVDKDSGSALDGPVRWIVATLDDETVVASGLTGGQVTLSLEPGTYAASAELEEKSGGATFEVSENGAKQTVPLSGNLPEATVTPASPTASAASTIEIGFTGPEAQGDFLRIITPEGERLETDLWEYTEKGNPVKLALPTQPGAYEIAYVWSEHGERVLARAPITVTEAAATLTFPPAVAAGSPVDIAWQGPGGSEDWIGIVPAGGTVDDYAGRWKSVADGSPVEIRAPSEAGTYDVIYVAAADQGVVVRQQLEVSAAGASVSAAETVEATAFLDVTWSGPGGSDDWIGFAPTGAAADTYLTWERPEGGIVRVAAPMAEGSYELRYILSSADGVKVLASQPVTVVAPQIVLEAPSEVSAGAPVEVKAAGPANNSNWIGFATSGDGPAGYVSGSWDMAGNITDGTITLTAPTEPGIYELRFVLSAEDQKIAATQTVTVK